MEKHYELQQIEVSKISFDENNPRGESEEKITSDSQFKQLVASIKEFNVLMPLIVKKMETGYILIDGERRLRACIAAGLQKVPAHVVKSDVDGRILAYQVHMLRKDWSTIIETKSLKFIVKEIIDNDPEISETELKRQIKEITNATDEKIKDWIILLKHDDDIVKKVIEGVFPMSHLIQNESGFLNKIKISYPDILKTLTENQIRSILAKKAEKKLLGNTRYLMDIFKNVFNCETHKKDIEALLLNFLKQPDSSIHKVYEEYEKLVAPAPPALSDQSDKKPDGSDNHKPTTEQKQTGNTGKEKSPKPSKPTQDPPKPESSATTPKPNVYHSITLTKKEELKIKDIRPKFELIGKTFSKEELEYIKEAIACLEYYCYKAAILMIWSSGVSRILQFIEKDLTDFNTSCQAMKSHPTSVYKHYAKSFQTSASNIEEIRQASLDMQLVSFLCFKKFINEPDFKKLKGHYDSRCDCAHPTKITITPNEIISIFENVYRLILTNPNLK